MLFALRVYVVFNVLLCVYDMHVFRLYVGYVMYVCMCALRM